MRKLKLFLSLLVLVTCSVGKLWAADPDYTKTESWDFGTSGNTNWSGTAAGYCGGCGQKSAASAVSKANITNFSNVDFSKYENVKLEITVKAGTNGGTNSYTVTLIDKDSKQVSTYTITQTGKMGSGSNAASASESTVSFSPTVAFSGYKIEYPAKGFLTQTKYTLTYDDKAACSSEVAITKGSETNGTYTLSDTKVCADGDGGTITISDITPADGYAFDEITTSASGEVDNTNKKVTGIKEATTITVKFKELQKYTVSFSTGTGNPEVAAKTETTAGAGITLPAGPTPACSADGWTFAGWKETSAVTEQTTTAPTLLAAGAAYAPTDNVTLYAVYKQEAGTSTGSSDYTITFSDNSSDATSEISAADLLKYIATNASKVSGFSDIVKCYKGATGLKLSSKKNNGSFAMTLSDSVTITKVVLNTQKKSTTQGASYEVAVGNTAFSTTSTLSKDDFVNVEFTGTKTKTDSIHIASLSSTNEGSDSDGRVAWLKSIAIYFEANITTYNYLSAPSCCTKHAITVDDEIAHGSVEADLEEACEDVEVTLTPKPDAHCRFVEWNVTDEDEAEVTVTNNKFSMPASAVTVSATFEEIKNTVTFAAPTGGTLAVKNGDDAVETGASILEGTALTVTATADAENHYIGGTIKVVKTSDESDVTASVLDGSKLTMPDYAITISATFTPTYEIKIEAEGGNVALVYTKGGAADGYAIAGTTINVEATADDAHEFTSLAISENVTEPTIVENIAEFTMPAEAVTITATFAEKTTPTINVDADALAFDPVDYKGELTAKTFKVSGVALAVGKLSIASNNDAFTVAPEEIDVDGTLAETQITVTPVTTACGAFNGKITISGGNATAKEVALSLTVNKLAANLSWGLENDTVVFKATDKEFQTLTNPRNLPVTYSSFDTDVATIDEEGAITLVAPGQTLIIANFAGNDTVTALEEDELYYTLTVLRHDTVRWYVNNELKHTQIDTAGVALTGIPEVATLPDDCLGKEFIGWGVKNVAGKQDLVNTENIKMPEGGANYYAVFATKESAGEASTTEIKFSGTSNTNMSGSNDAETFGLNDEEWSVVGSKGSHNSYPGLNSGDKEFRLYGYSGGNGNTITIIAPNTIDSVKVTFTDSYSTGGVVKVGSSTMEAINGAYPIGATEFVIANTNNGSTQVRIKSINVIFNAAASYSDTLTICPHCETVTLAAAQVQNGSIAFQVGGEAVTSVKTCEAASVDVVASPATGYKLTGVELSDNIEGASYADGKITIPEGATGTLTATATFSKINYTVTMAQTGDASATLSEDQENKHYGDKITVSTDEPAGYAFIGWSASPAVTFANEKALSTSFTMPNGNVTVTAQFAKVYSVTEAIDAIDNEGTTSNVYVEGYVTADVTNTSAGWRTYFIQDLDENGFLTGTEFEIYKGKNIGNQDFAANAGVSKGAKVRAYGNITYYSSGSVYEFSSGSYLVSYVEANDTTVRVYGTAATIEYLAGEDFDFTGLKVKNVYGNGYAEAIDTAATKVTWTANPAQVNETGTVQVKASYVNNDKTYESAWFDVAVTLTTKELQSIALSETEYTIWKGEDMPKPTVTAHFLKDENPVQEDVTAAAKFTGFDASVAGEQTVTVSYTFGEVTKTAEYKVTVQTIANTPATAYTVAEAIALYEAGKDLSTKVYVRGIVDRRTYYSNSGSFNVFVKDALSDEAEFEFYTFYKDAELSQFAGESDINVKDILVGYGELTKFNTTYEFKKNCYLVSRVAYTELSWSATTGKAYLPAGSKDAVLPTLKNDSNVAITYSSETTTVATINAETGAITPVAVGTSVIKAAFAGDATHQAAEATYTLTVVAPASVVITGDGTTAYEAGETFSFAGLGAKAVYTDEAEYEIPAKNITWAPAEAPVINAAGNVEVTATWQGLTSAVKNIAVEVKKHAVNIETPTNGTITVQKKVNDEWTAIAENETFVKGTELKVVFAAAEGYVLTESSVSEETDENGVFSVGTTDVTISATFNVKTYTITFAGVEYKGDVIVKVGEMNIASGDKKAKGTELQIFAMPEIGYKVTSIKVNDVTLAGAAYEGPFNEVLAGTYTVGEADVTISATFEALPTYYMKNNWNGASDWSWIEMTYIGANNYKLENVVFGGTGVNYNTAADDEGATWVALADIAGDEIGALDTVRFVLNPVAGTVTAELLGKYVEPVVEHTYTVAGEPAAVFGEPTWDPTAEANNMVKQNDGTYKWEKTEITLPIGKVEFKVCQDYAWAPSWPAQNYELSIPEDGIYTITITFDPAAEEDKVAAVATKTGSAEVDPVVEIGAYFTEEWTMNEMELSQDKKSASFTKTLALGDTIEFKIRLNGSDWRSNAHTFDRENNYYSNIVVNEDDNMLLVVDATGEYTFTWNFEGNSLEITYPTRPNFYITGTVAGGWAADQLSVYGISHTFENLAAGDHKFKVTTDGTWNTEKGYAQLTAESEALDVANIYTDADGNVRFTLAQAGDVTVNFVMDGENVTTFTVAGNFTAPEIKLIGSFDGEWDEYTQPIVMENGTGEAHKTLNLAEGTYYFKLIVAGDWNGRYYDDDYEINREHNWINEFDFKQQDAKDPRAIKLVVDKEGACNFTYFYQGALTVDFPEIIYRVAGDVAVMGSDWNIEDDANKMTLNAGIYTLTKTSVILNAGTYDYKVVGDGTWAISYPQTTENAHFTVNERAVYDVTFTFNASTKAYNAEATYKGPATGIDNTEAEVKAVKFIENGQIFILRGEKVYTITGELVK